MSKTGELLAKSELTEENLRNHSLLERTKEASSESESYKDFEVPFSPKDTKVIERAKGPPLTEKRYEACDDDTSSEEGSAPELNQHFFKTPPWIDSDGFMRVEKQPDTIITGRYRSLSDPEEYTSKNSSFLGTEEEITGDEYNSDSPSPIPSDKMPLPPLKRETTSDYDSGSLDRPLQASFTASVPLTREVTGDSASGEINTEEVVHIPPATLPMSIGLLPLVRETAADYFHDDEPDTTTEDSTHDNSQTPTSSEILIQPTITNFSSFSDFVKFYFIVPESSEEEVTSPEEMINIILSGAVKVEEA